MSGGGVPPSGAAFPVGLIGVGKHGSRYLTHICRDLSDELRLVAISRQDVAAGQVLAREIGARFHRDAAGLIADPGVRAVIAVVPPSEHAAVVSAVARERKPLLIEKPFAATLVEALELRRILDQHAVPCMVAHTLRWNGVVQAAKAQVASLGTLHQVGLGQSFEPSSLAWLDDPGKSGGGNILHTGVHMFDLLRYLTDGRVTEVACLTERVVTRETEDSFAASMSVEVGHGGGRILASVAGSRTTQSRMGSIRVIGERGQIIADHVLGEIGILHGRKLTTLARPPELATVLELLKTFCQVLEGSIAPPVGAYDGLAAVAVADACYRSAKSGRRERVHLEP